MLRRIIVSSKASQYVASSHSRALSALTPIYDSNRPQSSTSPSRGSGHPSLSARQHGHISISFPRIQLSNLLSQKASISTTPQLLEQQQPQHQQGSTKPRPDPSIPHHNLETFLSHATRTRLALTSTTYLGTRYEYLTQRHLKTHLSFDLTRVGRRGDSGIDLLGTWHLASILRRQALLSSLETPGQSISGNGQIDNHPLQVLVQCKRLMRNSGPSLIRELEGSFRGAPSKWREDDVLGIMVCTRPATKGVREAMGRSSRGLVWVMLEEEQVKPSEQDTASKSHHRRLNDESEEGEKMPNPVPGTVMRQFLYNAAAAAKCGLEGVSVGMKYAKTGEEEGIHLLWRGNPIDFELIE